MDDHYIHDVRKGLDGLKEKPYALFYSHGGGRVKDAMLDIFKRVGKQIGELVGSRGRPDPQVLEKCKAFGKELAEAVSHTGEFGGGRSQVSHPRWQNPRCHPAVLLARLLQSQRISWRRQQKP